MVRLEGLEPPRLAAIDFESTVATITPQAQKSFYGDPRRTRTPDPVLRRHLLYPAELWSQHKKTQKVILVGPLGLEPRYPVL